jgi:hypothetical protein
MTRRVAPAGVLASGSGRAVWALAVSGRAVVVVAAVLAVVALAGCGSSAPPTVEFRSSAGGVRTGPAQYCDVKVTSCANHPDAVVKLVVPPGQPLSISVPRELAAAPWQVVFGYRTTTGERVDGRSPVFPPNQRTDYQLVLPDPTDQLLTAQVQQFGGATPTTGPNGEVSFPIRGSWVLTTS